MLGIEKYLLDLTTWGNDDPGKTLWGRMCENQNVVKSEYVERKLLKMADNFFESFGFGGNFC